MNKSRLIGILGIIFGLLIIIFPAAGITTASTLIGLAIILIGIFSVVLAYITMEYNDRINILILIIGIILFIIGLLFIIYPQLLNSLIAILVYIAGLILIIMGILNIIYNRYGFTFYTAISSIVLGSVYLVLGYFFNNTNLLGYLLGLWLVIAGIISLIYDYR